MSAKRQPVRPPEADRIPQLQQLLEAETALRESEQRYRRLFEEGTEGIALADLETGILLDCNRAFLEIVEYSKAELIGQSHRVIHAPEDRTEETSKTFNAHRHGQAGQALESTLITKHGVRKQVEIKATVLELNGRQVMQGFFRDISKRKQFELALRESEERYRLLFNGITDAVFVHEITAEDLPGSFLAVNDALCRRLGYSREELLKMTVLDIDAPESQVDRTQVIQKLKQGEDVLFEQTHAARDGRRIPVEIHVQSFVLQNRRVVLSVARDITERKRAERALIESEVQLRLIWDNVGDGMRLTDEQGRVQRVNQAYCRLVGKSRDKVEGRLFTEAYAASEQADILATYQRRFHERKIEAHLERTMTLWDGQTVSVELSSTFLHVPGRPEMVLSVIRDVSERKQAAQAQALLEAQLRQAQKMEAIGELAGGVAHDFNNLLTAILGNASLLGTTENLPPADREMVQQISAAAWRAANLTRQLLAFSRKQVMQIRTLDFNLVLGQIIKMLQRVLGEHITLQCNYAPQLPAIEADASMLEQVILNLAVNARDAMAKGGRLLIATEAREVGAAQLGGNAGARPGRYVVLVVSDTGCGMDEATRSRVFEPFFTTKEVGQGTGLGTAIVYGIVKQHSGWVEVTSEVGRGTTFTVFLPATTRPVAPDEDAHRPNPVVGGQERILLVEDDPSVRQLVRTALERLGYTVLEAGNGPKALQIWQAQPGQIDLLLTDIVMPDGMNGKELADALRRLQPDLKVIFSSGYSREILDFNRVPQVRSRCLAKPFDLVTLANTVRQLLNERY